MSSHIVIVLLEWTAGEGRVVHFHRCKKRGFCPSCRALQLALGEQAREQALYLPQPLARESDHHVANHAAPVDDE